MTSSKFGSKFAIVVAIASTVGCGGGLDTDRQWLLTLDDAPADGRVDFCPALLQVQSDPITGAQARLDTIPAPQNLSGGLIAEGGGDEDDLFGGGGGDVFSFNAILDARLVGGNAQTGAQGQALDFDIGPLGDVYGAEPFEYTLAADTFDALTPDPDSIAVTRTLSGGKRDDDDLVTLEYTWTFSGAETIEVGSADCDVETVVLNFTLTAQ